MNKASLLRAEVRRFRSRRFIRVLLALGVVGFLAGIVIASTQFSKPNASVLADAQRSLQRNFAQSQKFHQLCLDDARSRPPGVDATAFCGPEPQLDQFGSAEDFISKQPFVLASDGLNGSVGVGFATAALVFLIGATFIGAEWSSKSLVALLFWEPRRPRVMGTKLAVLVGATAVIAALAQLAWLGAAKGLASARGTSTVPNGFYGDLAQQAGRSVLIAVIVALLGFGFANAIRNTAAALGVGFVYFAVVENIIRAVKPRWSEWLITDNAAAFLQRDRYSIIVNEKHINDRGVLQGSREIVITHLQAGLWLAVVAAVVVAIGVLLFARRDLS